MLRVIVDRAGGPEVLQLVDSAMPVPRKSEIRIRVEAAGVAYGDVMRRRGVLAPRASFTPGYEVCGLVDALGAAPSSYRIGERVAAMMPRVGLGGYAEYVCVPAVSLVRVPASVSAAQAVCLGLNYITAYQLLHRYSGLVAGQTMLVHGAAGGVGSALLELGRLAGMRMYGCASAGKHHLVQSYGATAIDYRREEVVARVREMEPEGVHAVFDGIGGAHLRRSYAALAARGTLVAFGVSGDVDAGYAGVARGLGHLLRLKCSLDRRRLRFYAITLTPGARRGQCRDDWQHLLALCGQGRIAPRIAMELPLVEVVRAHQLMDSSRHSGKIVLRC